MRMKGNQATASVQRDVQIRIRDLVFIGSTEESPQTILGNIVMQSH